MAPAFRMAVMLAATAVCALVAWRTDQRLDRQLRARPVPLELVYLPPTRFLRTTALGYEHVLADVLWFRTISYFGQHYWTDHFYPWLAAMCDTVTDLDPGAEYVYRFGGVILPWEAARADAGIALLEKGTRNLPASWRLRYMLGFSYYFFKDDLTAASQSLRQAAALPGAPSFVGRLAAVIDAAGRGPDSAIEFLDELARNNVSADVRHALHDRIRQLELARDVDALDHAVAAYRGRFGRLPDALTELVSSGLLVRLPPEPYGGTYLLNAGTGTVRSSTGHQPWRLGRSRRHEEILERQRIGERP